jgi:DNA topoisomerase-2
MVPYFRGFQGTVMLDGSGRYKVTGVYQKSGDQVTITEIPVGTKSSKSFSGYKSYLEKLWDNSPSLIRQVEDDPNDVSIHMVVTFQPDQLAKLTDENLEKLLKLSSSISTKNMNLYTSDGVLHHYNTTLEILKDFIDYRVQFYEKRKKYMLDELEQQFRFLAEKVRFIQYEIYDADEFTVRNKRKPQILKLMLDRNFLRCPKKKKSGGDSDTKEDEDDEDAPATASPPTSSEVPTVEQQDGDYTDFNYLVRMPIVNQTVEMIEKLKEDQRKKEEEIAQLANLTAVDLYSADLTEFKKAHVVMTEKWKAKEYSNLDEKKSGAKKVARKPRAKVAKSAAK